MPHSEHEQFLYGLLQSDLTQAEAEAAWRQYYAGLSDEAKLQAWQEYYARLRTTPTTGQAPLPHPVNRLQPLLRVGSVALANRARLKRFFAPKNQLRSIAIGLASGGAVVAVFMFALFNEAVITPLIRPAQAIDPAPVVNLAGVPEDPSPKIRVPKINVDIPVVYGLKTTDAKQFEMALDQGVVHYPTTVLPGQPGNTAYFGHSSNNIFNPGKYKFAFVLLHELLVGDTFYLTHDGKLYTYEMISRKVVKPSEVSVLGPVPGEVATATLITCDPPGTSNNRLVVVGKQVNPVPAVATPATPAVTAKPVPQMTDKPVVLPNPDSLPGNGPGLLERIWTSIF
jgi:LPXTG-site transpeptidase (sortase) family protein